MAAQKCINRNIVECKDKQAMKNIADSIVLIETLWNVKFLDNTIHCFALNCINRNIVECKDNYIIYNSLLINSSINRNIVECKDQIL